METQKIDLKILLPAAAAVLCIEWAGAALIHRTAVPSMIILGAVRVFETTALLSIVALFAKQGLGGIGIHSSRLLFGVKQGLLWSLGFGFLVGVVFAVLLVFGVNPAKLMKTALPKTTDAILLFFLVGGLISPIAEEIFFRGILYGFFRKWGVGIALLISTLLFAVPHALTAHRIPSTQIAGGVLFALAYEKENNLMVPITIHVLGNLAIFGLGLAA